MAGDTAAPSQAVILCGGVGSRLGPLTAATPKPLLDVGGKPFLERLLGEIRRFGIRRILFLAAFRSGDVEAFARGISPRLDLDGETLVEPDLAGTGGALWHARDRLDDAFFLFNGDSWFDIDVLDLGHCLLGEPAATVGMALRQVDDAARFGTVDFDGRLVSRFQEKTGLSRPGLVNGGVYAMRRAVVEVLAARCSLEQDGLTVLAGRGRVVGRRYPGFFLDIGVPDDYRRSHVLIPQAQARSAVFPGARDPDPTRTHHGE